MLVTYTTPNNVSDLMVQAAEALRNRDEDHLQSLLNTVRDWLQLHYETEAQVDMLEAMYEAVHELKMHEAG